MNGPRCTLTLLSIAVNCCVAVPIASSQHLTNQWVEEAAGPLVENRIVDGLSVGYIEGDHFGIVHLGSSNRAKKKANYLTLYELGSISKVFTGLLLADAVVRGEIDLNAAADVANSAGMRLPSRDGRSIQWIDLSTHRSGLPRLPGNFQPTDWKNPYHDYDSNKAADFLNQYELPRRPGESQEYSNLGGSVLGYLLAQNAGKSYEQLLRERIAEPLKMTDCTVSLSSDQRKRLATPHEKFGSAAPPWTCADLPGAGGIRATMRDMMRFAKAQLNPPSGTLGEAIELAWKQHAEADESGPAMGLGWVIVGDGETRWHNGGTGGSASAIFINRQLKCAVIVLCNTSVTDIVEPLAMQLVMRAAGQEVEPKPRETPVQDSGDYPKLAPYTGVRWEGDEPVVKIGRQWLTLVSLDGIAASDIVAFSQRTYKDLWQKRFAEDLVEVLAGMGHEPKDTVRLVVSPLGSSTTRTLKGVAMTAANRQAIRESAPAIGPELRRRLEGRYQLTPDFIFDVRDVDGHLMVGITNQPTQEVFPDSPTRWSYRGIDAALEFKLPKAGPASSLVLHQDGAKQSAYRMKPEPGNTSDQDSDNLAIDAKLRRRLVGRYQLNPTFIFTVRDVDGHLMVSITNQPTQEVYPDSATRWSYRGIDATLEFKLPKTGRARSLVLHQDGMKQTARRID